MTLQTTGPISANDINTELELPPTGQLRMGDEVVRELAGRPTGKISFSDFYGKQKGQKGKMYYNFWGESNGVHLDTGLYSTSTLGFGPYGGMIQEGPLKLYKFGRESTDFVMNFLEKKETVERFIIPEAEFDIMHDGHVFKTTMVLRVGTATNTSYTLTSVNADGVSLHDYINQSDIHGKKYYEFVLPTVPAKHHSYLFTGYSNGASASEALKFDSRWDQYSNEYVIQRGSMEQNGYPLLQRMYRHSSGKAIISFHQSWAETRQTIDLDVEHTIVARNERLQTNPTNAPVRAFTGKLVARYTYSNSSDYFFDNEEFGAYIKEKDIMNLTVDFELKAVLPYGTAFYDFTAVQGGGSMPARAIYSTNDDATGGTYGTMIHEDQPRFSSQFIFRRQGAIPGFMSYEWNLNRKHMERVYDMNNVRVNIVNDQIKIPLVPNSGGSVKDWIWDDTNDTYSNDLYYNRDERAEYPSRVYLSSKNNASHALTTDKTGVFNAETGQGQLQTGDYGFDIKKFEVTGAGGAKVTFDKPAAYIQANASVHNSVEQWILINNQWFRYTMEYSASNTTNPAIESTWNMYDHAGALANIESIYHNVQFYKGEELTVEFNYLPPPDLQTYKVYGDAHNSALAVYSHASYNSTSNGGELVNGIPIMSYAGFSLSNSAVIRFRANKLEDVTNVLDLSSGVMITCDGNSYAYNLLSTMTEVIRGYNIATVILVAADPSNNMTQYINATDPNKQYVYTIDFTKM